MNILQIRWLEILKDYYMSLLYNLSKANMVADAKSRVSMGSVTHVVDEKKEIVKEVNRLDRLVSYYNNLQNVVSWFVITPN